MSSAQHPNGWQGMTDLNGRDAVIIGAARTPFARLLGGLKDFSAAALGGHVIKAALERAGIDAQNVEAVVMGQAVQAGCGQNPARQAALRVPGLPASAHAETVNKVCLSGLSAVIHAARLVRLGEADVLVAGGMESMTNAPHLLPGSRGGWKYGDVTAVDSLAHDGLTDAADQISMGSLTDAGNDELRISREDQDACAAASHQRAASSRDNLQREIVSVEWEDRRGRQHAVTEDEGVREDTTADTLAALKPAFSKEGTITAGNSSPLSDGAAAVVVVSRAWAEEHGANILATIGSAGHVAGPDNSLHAQPARAITEALERSGMQASELDVVEINEAFASVSVQSHKELGLDPGTANAWGGAIALGHPLGASGARLVVTACYQLEERGGGTAAVALCGGGGQGDALLLHR